MALMTGVILALVGGLCVLAGRSDMRRSRLLRRRGVSAWAMAVPWQAPAEGRPDAVTRRIMLQYQLEDGRVVEQLCPGTARRRAALEPGQKVLVWYDPADPQDLVVYGRDTRRADLGFVAAGALCMLAGAAIAATGH